MTTAPACRPAAALPRLIDIAPGSRRVGFSGRPGCLALVFVFGLGVLAGCSATALSPSPPAAPAVTTPPIPSAAAAPLVLSPNRIIGRVLAVDAERGFAFVDIVSDAPPGALAAGADLTARTLDLRETGRLRASSYVRGKTLGTRILSGQPSPGDEVVWQAP